MTPTLFLLPISAAFSLSLRLSAPTSLSGRTSAVVMMPWRGSAQCEAAKQAWLAKADAVRELGPSKLFGSIAPTATVTVLQDDSNSNRNQEIEDAAKKAWLAKLDAPTWGKVAKAMAAAPSMVVEPDIANDGAHAKLSREEEAKKAWLAKLDAPTWGVVAAAIAEVADVAGRSPPATPAELMAKEAWLARLDAPTWKGAAATLIEIAGTAAVIDELSTTCESGEQEACTVLSREQEAKKAWLAKLDAPTWGKVTAAMEAVASVVSTEPAMSAEEIAKAEWLAKQDSDSWRA